MRIWRRYPGEEEALVGFQPLPFRKGEVVCRTEVVDPLLWETAHQHCSAEVGLRLEILVIETGG